MDFVLNENTTRAIDGLSQNSNPLALGDPDARDAEPSAEGLPPTDRPGGRAGREDPAAQPGHTK